MQEPLAHRRERQSEVKRRKDKWASCPHFLPGTWVSVLDQSLPDTLDSPEATCVGPGHSLHLV